MSIEGFMGSGAVPNEQHDLIRLAGLAEQDLPAGALYVVALPIGNAGDVTLRAWWVLGHVDAIAAEDTRVTGPLLARFGIATPMIAAHQHNERAAAVDIIERLASGRRVALVTDAGTPGVSDPGALIVRAALEAGHRVIPVPGPSSALAAVSAGGLGVSTFRFVGFLPAAARERARALQSIAADSEPAVLFEAPHRIAALLKDLASSLAPDRRVVVARELTKKFESIRTLRAAELAQTDIDERGEYAVIIDAAASQPVGALDDSGLRWLDALLGDLTPARAAAIVSRVTGVPRAAVYEVAVGLKSRR
ncbi:MAG TPA: 16S rRNA (cytidine(1402)-2'-O)-methyltransferase [Burkholderiaceae bacterium]|nr:16S rRNA (cytidine(1402)-2'-O)-methyltransferase [Burkholderiaceae bacterium]